MNTLPVKRLLILLALAALLLAAPVFAAEEAPAHSDTAAAEAPSGLSTLVLLLGLGAVALVGGVAVLRENFKNIGGDSA